MSQSAHSTAVRRAHGVPVFVHAADAVRARTGEKPKVAIGPMRLGPTLGFFGHSIRKNGLRSRYVGEVTEIGDGDVLDLPGSPVIVGMPGHSPAAWRCTSRSPTRSSPATPAAGRGDRTGS